MLSLTPAGDAADPAVSSCEHNRREADWAATLEPDERATMIDLLGKLADAGQQEWVSHRF